MFKRNLTYADMYEYKDSAYDFVIRYPSFFNEQKNDVGYARFSYGDQWATVVLEGYVLSHLGRSFKEASDSLAHLLRATSQKQGDDYFVQSGPQYENESLIEGYSYYSKFIRNGKFWFVYTMLYPDRYQDVLTRLFKKIDDWQIWECPHLQFETRGESNSKGQLLNRMNIRIRV